LATEQATTETYGSEKKKTLEGSPGIIYNRSWLVGFNKAQANLAIQKSPATRSAAEGCNIELQECGSPFRNKKHEESHRLLQGAGSGGVESSRSTSINKEESTTTAPGKIAGVEKARNCERRDKTEIHQTYYRYETFPGTDRQD
jgi:hypothetical protein